MALKEYADTSNEDAAAKLVVRGLRQPQAGETVARQIYEAARLLGLHKSESDLRHVRRAWYGQVRLAALIETLSRTDPAFHQAHIAALQELLRKGKGR